MSTTEPPILKLGPRSNGILLAPSTPLLPGFKLPFGRLLKLADRWDDKP